MRKEYLFYMNRREHKIMRPTDKKLATEEESSATEEVPQVRANNFSPILLSSVEDGWSAGVGMDAIIPIKLQISWWFMIIQIKKGDYPRFDSRGTKIFPYSYFAFPKLKLIKDIKKKYFWRNYHR